MIDQKEKAPCASAVGSKISAQKKIYPDIAQVSGTFWQKFSPAIHQWNGVIECFAILQSIVSLMLSKEGTCAFKRL